MEEIADKEIFLPENKIPVCDDVAEYLSLLRSTSAYQKIIDEKFAAQKVTEGEAPLTREEISNSFETEEGYKSLFWNFYNSVIHLGYNQDQYSPDFRQALNDYKDKAVASLHASKGGDQQMAIEKDRVRSLAHDEAARWLVKSGQASNQFLGRILVRAFLVDQKYDVVESAREADMSRVLRQVGDDPKAIAEVKKTFAPLIGKKFFKPEEISQIQAKFLKKHPKASKKDPREFALARNKFLKAIIGQ